MRDKIIKEFDVIEETLLNCRAHCVDIVMGEGKNANLIRKLYDYMDERYRSAYEIETKAIHDSDLPVINTTHTLAECRYIFAVIQDLSEIIGYYTLVEKCSAAIAEMKPFFERYY